jgi:hypothetical protein
VARADWYEWHGYYDDPTSRISTRLQLVQAHLSEVLDRRGPGAIRVVVPCAGQGRDVFGVLVDHPRRDDVVATLIEIDPRNVAAARRTAEDLDLPAITVVEADAGRTDAYLGAVPASILLFVGMLDHLTRRDVAALIAYLPHLCDRGAIVIWAQSRSSRRHSVASLRERFEASGFGGVTSEIEHPPWLHIGVERFDGTPRPLESGVRLFRFRDIDGGPRSVLRRIRRSISFRTRRLLTARR